MKAVLAGNEYAFLQSLKAALEFYASKLPRAVAIDREIEGFTA